MPNSPTRIITRSAAVPRLLKGLDGIDLSLVSRARKLRQDQALQPALVSAAAASAQALVAAARRKAIDAREPAVAAALAAQVSRARTAKGALLQRRPVRRGPQQVLQALVSAARAAGVAGTILPPSPRAILLRGLTVQSDVRRDLAQALQLSAAAELEAQRFLLKRVSSSHAGNAELYSLRVPLAQPTTEQLHEIVWALRKSGNFASVRLDGVARNVFAVQPTHLVKADPDLAWPLRLTRCLDAHRLPPQPGGKALGEGIVIAHPDTGWAHHPQYATQRIDVAHSFNASTGRIGGDAARHSVQVANGAPNVTHGTATGSVMVGGTGRGTERAANGVNLAFSVKNGKRDYVDGRRVVDGSGALLGVAPHAKVRPIKFISDVVLDIDRTGVNGAGVVRFGDEDLVSALDYARSSGAHVVSLSVGGIMHEEVQRALDQAVEEDNLIVVAAAGQLYMLELLGLNRAAASVQQATGQVPDSVVLPAAYANVIAVAGCCPDGRPWDESLSGPNVDIAAPADGVWVADFVQGGSSPSAQRAPTLEAGSGTSFAAAFMAGVAALWLAHCGRDNLLRRYPRTPLAWVFRHQLQRCATAVPATQWDRQKFGPGVIDVKALLERPLPRPSDVRRPPATQENAFTVLSAASDSPAAQLIGDVWATLFDAASATPAELERLSEVAWVLVRAGAEATLAAGQQAMADLQALVDAGQATLQEVEASLKAAAEVIESAAEIAEDAVRGAADAGADAVDALVQVATDAGKQLGEAAEEVTEFLFGWLP